jgi:hypothetical protein
MKHLWLAAMTTVASFVSSGSVGDTRALSVAVLPLSAAAVQGDAIQPNTDALAALTAQLRAGIKATPLAVIPSRWPHDVGAPTCLEARCARRIGEVIGARVVVFGSVRRVVGIIWSTEASAVDVPSGKVLHTLQYSALGDELVMERGARTLGTCLGRLIAVKRPCTADKQGSWDVP